MYKAYADKAGFDVRKSTIIWTKGVISHRYLVCSKSGSPRCKDVDTMDTSSSFTKRRKTNIKVTGCKACIRLKLPPSGQGFEIYHFVEAHNHGLVSDYNMDLTRGRRQLQFSDKEFIHGLQTMGFGPTIAHRVDCHKKCVTFGAGLIHNETTESYQWLLNAFLQAHRKQPLLLKGELKLNEEIRFRVNKLVWNVFIKPETLESRWHDLIEEFNLGDNKWLQDMFAIRHQWVPAYFKELPMCCLMKTTSRCETSNSQFKVYSSPGNNLVQFMNCFEKALNAQRHVQRDLQYDTTTKALALETRLPIERRASNVYTITIFKEVQKEISKGLYHCARDRIESQHGLRIHFISHKDKRNGFVGEFKVTQNPSDNTFACSCMSFTRIGYLCRHIFCVFQIEMVDQILEKYIPMCWRSDVLPSSLFKIESRYGAPHDEKSKLRQQFLSLSSQCADRARGNTELLQFLVNQLQ
ncbi:protein FAR1-RELATED SEQUENCE 5-like [Bidens hawaiensis]|uniref:protein FAR1-RELATED SEQUENCE 5-like n=1 Tax=Bidens hawaiensis TaxID=980011 RepID=UPI00404B56B6